MAYNLLIAKGYQVVRCAGTQFPADLIAWQHSGHQLLVKTERARTQIGNPATVAMRYRGDLDALRALALPHFARVQLWVWDGHSAWRYFDVMAGGICEVADYV